MRSSGSGWLAKSELSQLLCSLSGFSMYMCAVALLAASRARRRHPLGVLDVSDERKDHGAIRVEPVEPVRRAAEPGSEDGHLLLDDHLHLGVGHAATLAPQGGPCGGRDRGRLHPGDPEVRKHALEAVGHLGRHELARVGGRLRGRRRPHVVGGEEEVDAEWLVGERTELRDLFAQTFRPMAGTAEDPQAAGVRDGGGKLRGRHRADAAAGDGAHARKHDWVLDANEVAQR